jgi:three-Cys-motif partner protein
LLNPKTALQVQTFPSDGLTVTASEPWFKVKVQVISKYLEAFMMQVAGRADEIIFVDLFAGSGLYALGHQKDIFPGAGFASLSSGLPITRWILCEHDPEQIEALRTRVDKYFRRYDVVLVDDHVATLAHKLQEIIPRKSGLKSSVFCLIDPFSMEISFAAIEKLSTLGWNFLIPFTFPLNSHSDYQYYLEENQERLVRYVGHSADGLAGAYDNWQFYQRLVRAYENNMLVAGMNTALSVHRLESHWMEVPAYYMGFFSRRISAKAVQQEVQSLTYPQFELF